MVSVYSPLPPATLRTRPALSFPIRLLTILLSRFRTPRVKRCLHRVSTSLSPVSSRPRLRTGRIRRKPTWERLRLCG